VIYLNHAGTSWPKAPGVAEATAAALTASPRDTALWIERARDAVCALLGIGSRERWLWTPGCTSALAVAIGDLPWRAGDRLMTSALEHHALVRAVEKLVRERGVVHEVVPRAPHGPFDLDHAARVLDRGAVRLVAVTHASNVTGEVLPVAELTALAHAHGALVLLDAAQTSGVCDVDVGALGVDAVVIAGHKGLLGPQGVGGMWAAPHVAFESPSAVCEVGARWDAAACAPYPGSCDVGSVPVANVAGLCAALDWRRAEDPACGTRALALASRLRDALRTHAGCAVLGADGAHTAALSVRIEALALADAEDHFARHGIIVRAGQHCAPMALDALGEPAGTVRISFGPFNADGDVDACLAAISAVS